MSKLIPQEQNNFLLYSNDNGDVKLKVLLHNQTIWLTQNLMADLFGCSTDNIGLHLKNIFNSKELQENSTTEDFSVVQKEGGRDIKRKVKIYNLDAIISVGYRVNSAQATQWQILSKNLKV